MAYAVTLNADGFWEIEGDGYLPGQGRAQLEQLHSAIGKALAQDG